MENKTFISRRVRRVLIINSPRPLRSPRETLLQRILKKALHRLVRCRNFNQMKPSYITFEYLLEIILKMDDENKCVNTFKNSVIQN